MNVVGALLAALLGTSGVAESNQHFYLAGPAEGPAITIVAHGPITGIGTLTAVSVDLHPDDNTYQEIDIAVIGHHTLTITVDGRFSTWPYTLDPTTCTQHGTLGGNWVSDLAGSGTFHGRFLTYASRGPAGCDTATIKGFVAGTMSG